MKNSTHRALRLAAWLLLPLLFADAFAQRSRSRNNPSRGDDRPPPEANPPQHEADRDVELPFGRFRTPSDMRMINGTDNNLKNRDWGEADSILARMVPAAYADGANAPSGPDRPSPRHISNAACAQSSPILSADGVTDMLWQWGQFLDHDLDLSPEVSPHDEIEIQIPTGDPFFDPLGTGTNVMLLNRSFGEPVNGVLQQVNEITTFIDGSNVYGSDQERADALRTLDGTGRLKTSAGDLLPFNTAGLPNAPSADAPTFFLAGDFRANEQLYLTVMHTLFVREHNYWADEIRQRNPGIDGDTTYEVARLIVGAELQAITYNEFIPAILGPDALPRYEGYRDNVYPGIANIFSTAAFRFGHTMLSSELFRLDANNQQIAEGHLSLAQAFFCPDKLAATGIDPYLRGLAFKHAQEIDTLVVDDVRNMLFGPPGAGGLDLASLNIQRGRDHGLPDYNTCRFELGLPRVQRFAEINPDPVVQQRLTEAYPGGVNQIDPWVGILSEPKRPGALLGETGSLVLSTQFRVIRDGDRYFYRDFLPDEMVRFIEQQTLARIIRRNTDIGDELQENVFKVGPTRMEPLLTNIRGDGRSGDMRIRFDSVPGQRYQILNSRDLANWALVDDDCRSEGWSTEASLRLVDGGGGGQNGNLLAGDVPEFFRLEDRPAPDAPGRR